MSRSTPSVFSKHLPRGPRFAACALILLFITTTVSASPTGSIAGSVKDPSGAAISGARLTLTNLATNAKMEAVSDTNGAFQFLQLAPAEYSLVVESQGFKKVTERRILVQVDQITHVDVPLEIGSVAQVVEVTSAATPLLETDRSTLSNVVDSQVISNMPLNARQYLDLALVTPGRPTVGDGYAGWRLQCGRGALPVQRVPARWRQHHRYANQLGAR